MSFRADKESQACNATADLATFAQTWVEPWLEGGEFFLSFSTHPAVNKNPREAWRLVEGLKTCRARYVPDETGKLAGVVASNHTAPQKFEELCDGILKYADPSTPL